MTSLSPIRVLPFTDENLRAALPQARKPEEMCSVCRAIGGSEHSQSYSVITPDKVLELAEISWARKPGAELHARGNGTWRSVVEPAKNRPQRRS